MSETPDLQALARRYLDLWQDQMTALAADPSLAEALARTVTLMGTGAAAFAGAASGMGGMGASTPTDAVRQPAGSDGAAAPGASATAAAFDDRGERARLLERLDALERRVAELEAIPRKKSRGAKSRA